jgi:hypothetical protein
LWLKPMLFSNKQKRMLFSKSNQKIEGIQREATQHRGGGSGVRAFEPVLLPLSFRMPRGLY